MRISVYAVVAIAVLSLFATATFAGNEAAPPSPAPQAYQGQKSVDSGAPKIVGAMLVLWYDGSVKDEAKLRLREHSRGWVKYKAAEAGFTVEEYDLADDVPKPGRPASDKKLYPSRVQEASAYIDNLAEGQVIVQTVWFYTQDRTDIDYPFLLNKFGKVTLADQCDFILKPMLSYFPKNKNAVAAVTTSPANPR